MKLGVVAIALVLLCAGPVLAQSDDDDDAPAKPQAAPSTSTRPSPLREARKVAANRCVAAIGAKSPDLRGNDRRNAVLTCIAKVVYDCSVRAQEQKVQRAKRVEFMDACFRSDK